MAYHGDGAARITRRLVSEQVPTPAWLNFQRYGTFAHIFKDQPESKRYAWTIAQVKSILHDETYIGNSVHNKQSNISFKCKKTVRKPPSEWVRIENTHDPLVSREVFDRVQEQTATRRRSMKDQTTQIFAGLVKCADCGWSMRFATNKTVSRPFSYFTCSRYGQGTGNCSNHYIRYDVLYAFVLSRVQYWAKEVQDHEDTVLQRLIKTGDKNRDSANRKAAADLKKAEKRQRDLDTLFTKLYEDRVSEKITERNFSMLSQKYQQEQEKLETKVTALQNQLKQSEEQVTGVEQWVELVKQFSRPTELTALMLNTLVEKILIHTATKNPDGTREQEIEIFFRFVGKID